MDNLNEIDESQYKADFMIAEGYIKFSSELLRLSLLAMGGFGALVLIKFKGEDKAQLLSEPTYFLISMIFFWLMFRGVVIPPVLCVGYHELVYKLA